MWSDLLGTEQLWSGGDWAVRFGLEPDPANTGYGHSPTEAAAVRPEGPGVFLEYLAAVQTRTEAMLQQLSPPSLTASSTGVGSRP